MAPQLSKEEIKEMENVANFTIQSSIATAVLLYLCKYLDKPMQLSY